jgi:DNA-binding NarL/FixJ family response regulator
MATPVTALNLNDAAEAQILQNAAAAAVAQAPALTPVANTNDTVTISPAAQQAAAAATAAAVAPTTATAGTQTATPAPTFLQIQNLIEQGLSPEEIALQLGISLQAVEAFLGTPTQAGTTTNTLA